MEAKDMIAIIMGVFGAIPSYIIALRKSKPYRPTFSKYLRDARQSYPFFLGIFFTIVMIVLFVWPPPPSVITITSPMGNALVLQSVTVEGYSTRELSKDEHPYIVVEYGGRWWPQYAEITLGYSSSTKRWEFSIPAEVGQPADTGRSFVIRAIIVDDATHQRFQSWFQQAEWTGIPITEVNQQGKVRISDSVTLTRR
jgi:hypothetical protein